MLPIRRLIAGTLVGLVFGLFGGFLVVMGGLEAYRAQRLSDHGVTADARAFDCSIVRASGHEGYQLHYELALGGETYSATDATGRRGLWQEVPYETWEAARTTGTIAVRYLPEDPWVSTPEVSVADATGDRMVEMILGGLCCAVGLFFPLLVLFARRR